MWRTMPEAAGRAAAAGGTLHDRAELGRQVARMLQDPKAHALTTDFIDQWLKLRDLPTVEVNPQAFPMFDAALRDGMIGETSRFFDEFLRHPLPAVNIFTADFTYVTPPLPPLYATT